MAIIIGKENILTTIFSLSYMMRDSREYISGECGHTPIFKLDGKELEGSVLFFLPIP